MGLILKVDPVRFAVSGVTNIFVRATHNGKWGDFDITDLDKESLLLWLRSRGGANPWAEDCVGILLNHGHLHDEDQGIAVLKEEGNGEA